MNFYRLLLRCYPASFRNEYGGELAATFAARRAHVHTFAGATALWTDAILDVVGNALLAHGSILGQDLRYAARTLRRMPGFALTAIAVTAVGIGANAAAFSVADFVFLRPLPFATPDRLAVIWEHPPGYSSLQPSPANYLDWRAMSRSFDAMGAYHDLSINLVSTATPRQLQGVAVTGDLLPLLGARPIIGRLFSAEEDRQGAQTALLSFGLWQETFGADPAIVGRTIVLDGSPYVVTGVMPRSFVYPDRTTAIWVPMRTTEVADSDRNNNWFTVVGRLRPGVSVEQAQADMNRVGAQLAQQHPKENGETRVNVMRMRDIYNLSNATQARVLLLALCGAAICVLLITCANLANLLLARALARRREFAVRAALGAGRERLVRQLVTESLLLAVIGGALGVGLAVAAVPLLTALIPSTMPVLQLPAVDVKVLVVAALLTAITGIGFGVIPALRAGGTTLDALRDGGRAGGGRRSRLRSALVIAEVTMSVVLLVSAGLLLRALWRVQASDPGFRSESVFTLRTTLPYYKYGPTSRRVAFYDQVLTRVRAVPGVASAGYVSWLPMVWGGGIWPVAVTGEVTARRSDQTASLRFVTPGYFATMGIALRKGRDVSEADAATAPFSAVVSESFAQRYWPNGNAVGEHFKFALHDRTVIGVVRDVRMRGPERTSEPQVYIPYQQVPDSEVFFYAPKDLVIRSTLTPAALLPMVRRVIHEADPEQPISDPRTLSAVVSAQTAGRSMQARILGAFAAIALLLAAIGIHGVLAFTVSQRRREMGVRMALGARRSQVVLMVVTQGGGIALAGLIPGFLLAWAAARAMGSILAGVDPHDLLTFCVAITLTITMVIAGSWIPALTASRVEPSTALQNE